MRFEYRLTFIFNKFLIVSCMDFSSEFVQCFTMHLYEREPLFHGLSLAERTEVVFEYHRFLRLKKYLFHQREAHKSSLSAEALEKIYPELISLPQLIRIAWERHILWTQSYREYCVDNLHVFIESKLVIQDESTLKSMEEGHRILLFLYYKLFQGPPPIKYWPHDETEILQLKHDSDNIEIYPPLERCGEDLIYDGNLLRVQEVANSIGFDIIEPFHKYEFEPDFASRFKVFILQREPNFCRLSILEYESLIHEYIKFMIIMKTVIVGRDVCPTTASSAEKDFLYPNNVAPSGIVDLVWHAHILCTEEYREYCNRICGRYLDHHPTIMNTNFARNDNQGYADTIRVYEELFEFTAPRKWWPRGVDIGFAEGPRPGAGRARYTLLYNLAEAEKKSIGYKNSTKNFKCLKVAACNLM